jgi:Rieske 2Fe-2S family protein
MRTFVKAAAPPAAKTLDARWYLSGEVFERERERIFARSWICAGRSAQIAEPGQFFLSEICGENLIVTRDREGRAHAFYNVCRHRGTRMCTQSSGTFKNSIQCPYHAWTYALDGRLTAARNMEGTEGFDESEYPLREAGVHEWGGFIFISLDPKEPFDRALKALGGNRFAQWDIADLRCAARIEYDVACNWKLIFQNYSECYHCPVIHPQLERLSPSESGRNDLTEGAVLGGYSTLRERAQTLTSSGERTRALLPGLTAEEHARVYYYTVFPSMLLSLHPDYVMAHFVQPLAPGRTAISCEWYFHPDAMSAPDFDAGDAVEFWDTTNRQDWHVSELSQLGIASRAYAPGPYSQQEGLLHAFDRHYLELVQA